MMNTSNKLGSAAQLLAAATGIGIGILSGCGDTGADPQGAPVAAAAVPSASQATGGTVLVTAGDYVDEIDLPGASVRGFETTQLVAKQAGYVKLIGRQGDEEIDIGMSVKAGGLLAELDIPELEKELLEKQAGSRSAGAEVVQAAAAVKIATAMVTQVRQSLVEKQALKALREVEMQRIARLVKMGAADLDQRDEARFRLTAATAAVAASQAQIVTAEAGTLKSKADLARAEADGEVAAAAVKRLEALNSYRYVRAPFDGVVVSRHVDRGAFVRPAGGSNQGSPLFEMTRIDRIRVVAFVPPGQVARVAVGQSARFHTIGGLPGKEVRGTVARSARALAESSRKMRIEMHIQNASKTMPNAVFLAPGLFGTLTVQSRRWEKDKKLALVPTAAIGTDDEGRRFVVVVASDQSRRVDVEIIFDDAKQVGIVGEVHPGDMVRIGGLSEY